MSAAGRGLGRVPTFLRTIWYLRPQQVVGQLRRALASGPDRPVRRTDPAAAPALALRDPPVPFLPAPPHARWDGGETLGLLGREVRIAPEIDWDLEREGPLFAFHLHQCDWLRDPAAPPAARAAALTSWVARHRGERPGVGWHPANCSLRTLSWVKLLATPGALPADADTASVRAALADGVATIEARPETHLLANHYLSNLLALVLAGIVLEGRDAERWLDHAGRLVAELREQVLPDGMHQERSPMYHALLLEGVLDVLDAARGVPGRLPAFHEEDLAEVAARMRTALGVLTHPDGGIALFGDAAFGIAHPPDVLARQADALGVPAAPPREPGVLRDAGFVRLEAGPFVLMFTAAPPSPPHQPGHAHCDALSFELSVGRERVVTDTGVCEYVPGPRRDRARASASHAGLVVDGREQSELWGAHRVGGRADAGLVAAGPRRAEGVCSGWATPETLHRRVVELDAGAVRIHDTLDAPPRDARLVLPLAPGLEPVLEEVRGRRTATLVVADRRLRIELPAAATWRTERAPYYPEFGREQDRAVLVADARDLARADWRLVLE